MYTVVDTAGTPLDTFGSWAAAARFQTAWERANLRPATIRPEATSASAGLRVMMGASS